jgi:hypothetical protein
LDGGWQVIDEYDNVTNDSFLDEYYKIKRGIGQPEIIDKMIYERHDQRNCSPHMSDVILDAADRIRDKWKEEEIREFVFRMSMHILHLEETLKRNNIGFSPYMSYYNMPPEDGKPKCEQ